MYNAVIKGINEHYNDLKLNTHSTFLLPFESSSMNEIMFTFIYQYAQVTVMTLAHSV